jgi:mannose-6-phosphate isomerase-like protein (cupin superfamily)
MTVGSYTVIDDADLARSPGIRELVGKEHGVSVCVILVDMAPGEGVRLHRHTYPEIFIVQEGSATFRVGDESLEVHAPRTLIVATAVSHAFTNTGMERLRQVDIHLSPEFVTEWLE